MEGIKMGKNRLIIYLSVMLSLLMNCSRKDEWKGKIEFENDVKVVKNYDKGLWETSKKARRVIFKEELSIGISEGDENYIFHKPMDVIADNDGNIYVMDSGNNRVQKFDKKGDFLLSIGSRGQGPGEIANCEDIELDSKGNILVFDIGNTRITKYDSKGNLLGSFNSTLRPYAGVLDSEDCIYIYSQYKGKLIHKYNSQGEHLISFRDIIEYEIKRIEPHINGCGNIGVTEDDKILLVLTYPYTVYIYNNEGELLEKILTQTQYAQPPHITASTDVPPDAEITNFFISGVDISAKGYIFCRVIAFDIPSKLDSFEKIQELINSTFKKFSYVDIFSPSGHYLIHQNTENFSDGGYFDRAGYYYVIEEAEDYFRAVKYSIKFE